MPEQTIIAETVGRARILTLNRPERLNAYTTAMRVQLVDALRDAGRDDNVRVILVTGAGRGFCAGFDFKDGVHETTPIPQGEGALAGEAELVMAIYDLPKPVIGAINGAAVGAGAAMTLPMDLRLASSTAKIGFPFCHLGFVPEAASAWFLPRLVGPAQAATWFYTGELFGADEALRAGLVSEVLDPEDLVPRALALAEKMAGAAPASIALTRRMCQTFGALDGPRPAMEIDSRLVRERVASADAEAALHATLAKRAPTFSDPIPLEGLKALAEEVAMRSGRSAP